MATSKIGNLSRTFLNRYFDFININLINISIQSLTIQWESPVYFSDHFWVRGVSNRYDDTYITSIYSKFYIFRPKYKGLMLSTNQGIWAISYESKINMIIILQQRLRDAVSFYSILTRSHVIRSINLLLFLCISNNNLMIDRNLNCF